MSLRGAIIAAFAARLDTIKTAVGYSLDVKKVYYDDIPMGIQLQEHELPAIFLLDRADAPNMQHHKMQGDWEYKLQLWHNRVPDSTMLDYVRDVFKAVYANHATAQVNGAFRSIHPRIVEVIPSQIASDLNMIEANRVYEVSFRVHYRTELFDL